MDFTLNHELAPAICSHRLYPAASWTGLTHKMLLSSSWNAIQPSVLAMSLSAMAVAECCKNHCCSVVPSVAAMLPINSFHRVRGDGECKQPWMEAWSLRTKFIDVALKRSPDVRDLMYKMREMRKLLSQPLILSDWQLRRRL